MTRPLVLEFISALGMPPDEMMGLAADLGLSHVGLATRPITLNDAAYQPWNLLEDDALLRRTRAAMAQHEVRIAIGEGFLIRPDLPIQNHRPGLELMAELGVGLVNAVNLGGSNDTAVEAFANFAALAREHGLRATVEFLPMLAPADLGEALTFAQRAGAEILIDAMHFFRSGGDVSELRDADLSRIGHIQLCDVPMPPVLDDYGKEASQDRLPIGEGDLPLADLLAALPRDVMVGLELPMLSKAGATPDMRGLLAPSVAACRQLLNG